MCCYCYKDAATNRGNSDAAPAASRLRVQLKAWTLWWWWWWWWSPGRSASPVSLLIFAPLLSGFLCIGMVEVANGAAQDFVFGSQQFSENMDLFFWIHVPPFLHSIRMTLLDFPCVNRWQDTMVHLCQKKKGFKDCQGGVGNFVTTKSESRNGRLLHWRARCVVCPL